MASDIEFWIKEQRARRLVWAVIAVGCGAGLAMLAAFAFSILRAHGNQAQMSELSASSDRFSCWLNILLDHSQRRMAAELTGQAAKQDLTSPGTSANSDQSGEKVLRSVETSRSFDELFARLANVQRCEAMVHDWLDRKLKLDAMQEPASTRCDAALASLQECLERAAGQERLKRVVEVRQVRAAGQNADPALVHNLAVTSVVNDFLPLAQKELDNLALLIERMQNVDNLDSLSDIKDNQFHQALTRLQRQLVRWKAVLASDGRTNAERAGGLMSAVFGDGAWSDEDHQTIHLGVAGYFGLCQQRLELLRENKELQDQVAAAVAAAESAKLNLSERIRSHLQTLAAASTAGFELAWWLTLVVALVGGSLFIALSFKTAAVIRRQFREITSATIAARTSEQRVRQVVDASLDTVISMDGEGRIVGWNLQAETTFGWRASEVLGKSLAETIVPRAFREAHVRGLQKYLETGEGALLNKRVQVAALHRDGHELPIELTIVPARAGDSMSFCAFIRDITHRKQHEFAITQALTDATSALDVAPRVLQQVCELHQLDFGALWLVDPQRNALVCADLWRGPNDALAEFEHETRRMIFAPGVGLPGRAWLAGHWVGAANLATEESGSLVRESARGVFCGFIEFPLVAGNEVVGVIEFLRCAVLEANDELLLTLSTIGSRLGHLIQRERAQGALCDAEAKSRGILNAIPDVVLQIDAAKMITELRAAGADGDFYPSDQMLGKPIGEAFSADTAERLSAGMDRAASTGEVQTVEYNVEVPSARTRDYEARIAPMGVSGWLVLARDVSERKRLQCQLTQAQKLESIGQLAAGIAHEINTPIQYIGDNTRFLQESFLNVSRLLSDYEELLGAAKSVSLLPGRLAAAEATFEQSEVPYLIEEIPSAIEQTLDGIDRVATIVRAMKSFSHPGGEQKEPTDLQQCIENTILVARNEWKYVAEMVTEFDAELPLVSCLPGEFNQVVLNLIVNAAHAIADRAERDSNHKGIIRISTGLVDDRAEIRIGDNGSGIPEAIRARVFDPFFTTKEVGRGTGQGLAIAYAVIVEKHGGTISFETAVGSGTTFIIRLPLDDQPSQEPLLPVAVEISA